MVDTELKGTGMPTRQPAGEKENRKKQKHLGAGTECTCHGLRLEDPEIFWESDEDMKGFEKEEFKWYGNGED